MIREVMNIVQEVSWMMPIINILKNDILSGDKIQARKIKHKSTKYCVVNDQLYRMSYSSPLLLCVGPRDIDYALQEVYE